MTTIAFDGRHLAADRLAQTAWGRGEEVCKIVDGSGWHAAFSGRSGQQHKWAKRVEGKELDEVLAIGYPDYEAEKDDPGFLLVCIHTTRCWKHSEGVFIPVSERRTALGSGCDYAVAAMELGKTAMDAVRLAMKFDTGTGIGVDSRELP